MESWQSGNAADSKSADPVHPGAQVQILYSPYYQRFGAFSLSFEIGFFVCYGQKNGQRS